MLTNPLPTVRGAQVVTAVKPIKSPINLLKFHARPKMVTVRYTSIWKRVLRNDGSDSSTFLGLGLVANYKD